MADIKSNEGIILEVLNDKVDLDGGNYRPKIIRLDETTGTINLVGNRIYAMTIKGATNFVLPTIVEDEFMEINLMVKIEGTPSINWGTNYFFYKRAPEIATGNYDVYYNYDVLLKQWVCSVMLKGAIA